MLNIGCEGAETAVAGSAFQTSGDSALLQYRQFPPHLPFVVLRGRPTLRFFTASRSFGSITHMFPTLVAFSRPLPIIARTLLGVTFKRFAASAALMSFMAQSIAFPEIIAVSQ